MTIIDDYKNWKVDNFDLLTTLKENDSTVFSGLVNIIKVLDYLTELKDRTPDEDYIFEFGFNYLYDNFFTIKTIYDSIFKKDLLALEKCGKTVNLLLYVENFKNELLDLTDTKLDLDRLDDISDDLMKKLSKVENYTEDEFYHIDDMLIAIASKHELNYHPVEAIFYEIALTYDLIDDDEN